MKNSPIGKPHLQGEWRRRESNPRPQSGDMSSFRAIRQSRPSGTTADL
jgi:hypothetical protein